MGSSLRTKTGISKIYFIELPKEVQERFHYNPEKAAQFSAAVQAAAAQSNAVTPQQQTQAVAADLHTVREVDTDQRTFLDRPFVLKGMIELDNYYNFGYDGAEGTHYSFRVIESTGRSEAYMERAKAVELRQRLLSADGPLKGVFTVVLLSSRYYRTGQPNGLFVELLDYKLGQCKFSGSENEPFFRGKSGRSSAW